MKKLIFVVIITVFGFNIASNAQCINEKLSYPIYKQGAALVDQFDTQGQEIVRIEYDLVFTSKESFRNLSADWKYTIVGFGDDGVKDLDVKVYEYDDLLEKWSLITEDASTESFALVTVKPTKDALYKVEVIVYSFNEGYDVARYGLMYVHD